MRSFNTLFGALVVSAPLLIASTASAGNGGPSAGGISTNLELLKTALLLGIDLNIGWDDIDVDVSVCGDIDIDLLVGASCEVVANVDASVVCDDIHLGLAAYADCAADCALDANLSCTAACDIDCKADCALDINLDAELFCKADCAADIQALCTAKLAKGECDSFAECELSAKATCDATCHAAANLSVFADCNAKCDAACDAKCDANANLDCQVDCQAGLYAGLKADCTADVNADGALFCDGLYINGVVDVDACLDVIVDL